MNKVFLIGRLTKDPHWPKNNKKEQLSDYDDSVFNPEVFEQKDGMPF